MLSSAGGGAWVGLLVATADGLLKSHVVRVLTEAPPVDAQAKYPAGEIVSMSPATGLMRPTDANSCVGGDGYKTVVQVRCRGVVVAVAGLVT